jgi:hypothetical protein
LLQATETCKNKEPTCAGGKYDPNLLRDNLDENGGGNQSLKRRPAAKV